MQADSVIVVPATGELTKQRSRRARSIYSDDQEPRQLEAAERAFQFNNGIFFGLVFADACDEAFLSALGDNPQIRDGDIRIINQPLD